MTQRKPARQEFRHNQPDKPIRSVKKPKKDKPFRVESRYVGACAKDHPLVMLFKWHGSSKFETLARAEAFVAKQVRSWTPWMNGKFEYRIIDTRLDPVVVERQGIN